MPTEPPEKPFILDYATPSGKPPSRMWIVWLVLAVLAAMALVMALGFFWLAAPSAAPVVPMPVSPPHVVSVRRPPQVPTIQPATGAPSTQPSH